MFDLELYKKAEKQRGAYWTGGVNDELTNKLSQDLNIFLPISYIEFLKKYGEGGVCGGSYIFGIEDDEYSAAYEHTLEFRKKYKIDKKWLVIASESNSWEEYIFCLDTNRMKDGECPVIKYDYKHKEKEDFKSNFYELFNYTLERALYA